MANNSAKRKAQVGAHSNRQLVKDINTVQKKKREESEMLQSLANGDRLHDPMKLAHFALY